LYKFGFDKVAKSTCFSTYIKQAVKKEITSAEFFNNESSEITHGIRLVGLDMLSGDSLTPSICFSKCKMSVQCTAASFTIDPKEPFSCVLFLPDENKANMKHYVREVDNEHWTSYTKLDLQAFDSSTISTTETTTTTTIESQTNLIFDLSPNSILAETCLLGEYIEYNTTSQEECFIEKCDMDPRCAGACFTEPTEVEAHGL
jgi:hypothetical protein